VSDFISAARMTSLSDAELRHYSRHIIIPELGTVGQRRLKAARVLLVGAGGLGSPALQYLAAAGVGTIGIVEFDTIDVSNLQRQVLYTTGDVGRSKLECAIERLQAMNPHVQFNAHPFRIDAGNALELIAGYDCVVDGTDNFASRYIVNDACVLLGKPNVYASVFRFEGLLSVFNVGGGPCYRCLYPAPPPAGFAP
jgi:sulfur-carrier protein adenylyltransferase/sulfurtransferase